MATFCTTWEDDDCSRVVQLSVNYELMDGGIEIERVTPTSIQFLNTDGSPKRQIKVWTEKARQMLNRQYAQRVGEATLKNLIESDLAVAAQ